MTYRTIEADIENGRITGPESATLPASAHVLITLLSPDERKRPVWHTIHNQIGKLRLREETVDWQRDMRSEWDRCVRALLDTNVIIDAVGGLAPAVQALRTSQDGEGNR